MHKDVQEFLDQGQRLGLLSAATVERIAVRQDDGQLPTLDNVVASLVRQQALTAFQADQLLAGRGEHCFLAGRYLILEPLGDGGMGSVYKARDTKLNRLVAIKIMAARLIQDRAAVARFQREGRALARLAHPAIVQVFDVVEERGQQFLVMEYVEGTDLRRVLEAQGRLPPAQVAEYGHQVALGLQHAHEQGLIHRDLKPGNLLLAPDQRVKVLDLGLARFTADQTTADDLTSESAGMGTPDYAAPEQFVDARAVDARADVYALGCTLYHLLTGGVPFPANTRIAKIMAHHDRVAEPANKVQPDVPAELARVVQRMMARDPNQRYPDMRAVALALEPFRGAAASVPEKTHVRFASDVPTAITFADPAVRRKPWLLVGLASALVIVLALGALLLPRLLTADRPTSQHPPSDPPGKEPNEAKVLTVSQAEAGGGQYRTIGQALARVKPGMTVRVLDDAIYQEQLQLIGASRYRDVTLEAAGKATIQGSSKPGEKIEIVVTLFDTPGFKLRNFRLRSGAAEVSLLMDVGGQLPGVVLEGLDLESSGLCIEVRNTAAAADTPAVVRGCTLRGRRGGIWVCGDRPPNPAKNPLPTGRVLVHQNRFQDCPTAVATQGTVTQVVVAANLIVGSSLSAIDITDQITGAGGVLIANNTTLDCRMAFRLWDHGIKGKRMRVCNNLFLGPFPTIDMGFLDDGGVRGNVLGPGDIQTLAKNVDWRFDHNWREAKVPALKVIEAPFWIPPTDQDTRREQIPVLSRDADSPQFLQPAANSPLATAGAGGDLPGYVGAVAPVGAPPWDWNRTWQKWTAAQ